VIEGDYTFSPNGEWVRLLEFYCPGCGRQVETEYLPAGHPLTYDTEIDIDSIKTRLASGEARINEEGKLEVAL
jgi:acetophenone carboxylase